MKQTDRINKRKQRDDLIRIGSMMANLCFNLKQKSELSDSIRIPAKELQEQWDNVKSGRT